MATLTGLLGDYGSDDESTSPGREAAGTDGSAAHWELCSTCKITSAFSHSELFGAAHESSCIAGPAEEAGMMDAEDALSRPASGLLASMDGAPQVFAEQLLPGTDMAASPQQPAEFVLPPDIAEPPEQQCSAKVQVSAGFLAALQKPYVLRSCFPSCKQSTHAIRMNLAAGEDSQAAGDPEQR